MIEKSWLHKEAEKHDLTCLSKEYVNSKINYVWKCKFGHIWTSYYAYIKKTNWKCPKCKHKPLKKDKLEKLKNYAKEWNGKCLSTRYIAENTKYLWECKNGHVFKKTWIGIEYNYGWCPTCKKKYIQ